MAQYAASVAGMAIRLSRLTESGAIEVGPEASYVTRKFVSLSFTPEYEEGDEFTTKAADGSVCATYKAPDTLKRVTISIALCDPDPEFTEMIAGGTLLADVDGETVGWAAPPVGVDATPNGVAIEVWSKALVNGKAAAVNPYYHWVFPYAQMHSSGDKVIQNDMLANEFEGWGVGNAEFGDGPGAPLWPFASDTAVAFARTDSFPVTEGYNEVVAPAV